MRNRFVAVVCLTVGMFLAAGLVFAHHNQASFDSQVTTTVTGTVKEFNWMNPHSMLIVSGKDDKGEATYWAIEMWPPNSLQRDNGWTDKTFKPGDHVTIDGNPYRDGRAKQMIMPDGKEFTGRM